LIATDDSQVPRFIPEAVGSVVAQRPSSIGLARGSGLRPAFLKNISQLFIHRFATSDQTPINLAAWLLAAASSF